MKPCRRFASEGLDRLTAGQPLDEHFTSCDTCREARSSYEALLGDLRELDHDAKPPPDWQDNVWRRIGTHQRDRPGKRSRAAAAWRPTALAAIIAAAVLGGLLLRPTEAPTLMVAIERGHLPYRGLEAALPGDRLTIETRTARGRHTALRVYRNEHELVAECPGSSACETAGRRLRLTLRLEAIGRYQTVLLSSPVPLPPAVGVLDVDCGAAVEQGARIELGDEILIR